MNRRQMFAVCVLVVALIAGTWAVARVQESNDNTYSNIERFIQVLTKVRDNYVEPVSSDKLMDAAIRGMLRTLDPYSQYLDKDEPERLETTTHGAYAGMLSNGIGYVRLSNFSERSRQEMDQAFDKLEKMNPHGVIIDLRYNPGGLLSQAVEVAEEFTPRGKKVVYTRGRDSSQNRDFYSTAEHTHDGYPIVILVNQWTAPASEIVSGALQDTELGLVVGKTTFGKGLVQTVIPLTRSVKGPKLKLTTAKYYTPSGRCIQKDEQLKDGALAEDDSDDSSDGKPANADADSKKPKPEYRTEMGRVVYGGGGITPDIELGEVKLPRVIEDLEAKQVFFKYAVKYAVKHREPPVNYVLTS